MSALLRRTETMSTYATLMRSGTPKVSEFRRENSLRSESRMSDVSGSDTLTMGGRMSALSVEFPQFDPGDIPRSRHSPDSGFSESSLHILEQDETMIFTQEMCRELKTLTCLTEDFRQDCVFERESPRDLLDELLLKIRPFLVRLDEEVHGREELIRRNIDRSKINEQKIEWLLHYHRMFLDFIQIVRALTIGVFDKLEKRLRLQSRNCAVGTGECEVIGNQLDRILKFLDEKERMIVEM